MSSFKAFEKRNKTLLVEYKNQFKANSFNDKRIGENDSNLTLEDKMFKRFVAERKKSKDKKANRFNLNDNDDDEQNNGGFHTELTHFGQSLAQIEKFERIESSDNDDDDDRNPDPSNKDKGKISAKIVSENFFGGFDKKNDEESKKQSRKQWIDEMIAKSKQIKYERQKEKDKTLDLTEELDKEWRSIQPLISVMVNKNKEKQEQLERAELGKTKKADDYDCLVRSLQFDSKAKPQDKLKTEEELEKERLENLKQKEKELLDRMNTEIELNDEDDDTQKKKQVNNNKKKKQTTNHRSVDDMDFDDPEYLQYQNQEEIKQKRKNELLEEREKKEEKKLDEEEEEEDEVNQEESENDDEEDEDDENETNETKSDDVTSIEQNFKNDHWVSQFEQICLKLNNNEIDLNQFEKLIRSLITKLDPSRDEDNKKRLCLLTQHLVEFYQSLFNLKSITSAINTKLVNLCINIIYELTSKYSGKSTKQEPSSYIVMFRKILTDLNNEYLSLKTSEKTFPHLNILFTFKLVSILFPTSDFRHQITTPCLLIMTRYFTECSINTIGQLFRGSFLCHLCYEFTNRSKRFIPECVQFLNGVLYLSIDWKKSNKLAHFESSSIYETFKRTELSLLVTNKVDKLSELIMSQMSQIDLDKVNDSTKVSLIGYNIDLLNVFTQLYSNNECFREIFQLTNTLLKCLPQKNYPDSLQEKLVTITSFIDEKMQEPREHLKCLNKKPVPNKQFEPKIIAKSKFDPRHHNTVISEKQLLQRKYKKEHKAAIKEIRQDSQFLARVQLKEQLEKDAKRSLKVKEIMGSLSTQEGEYQKIKRMKN